MPVAHRSRGHLLRILGVGFGLAVAVGDVIGSGILRTPGEVAGHLGSGWLVLGVWLVGGLYALCGTVAVVELATMLPKAGGWYVYARDAFGEYGGFVVGLCDWTVQSASIAYLAVAFGEFTALLVPGAQGRATLAAVVCVVLLALVNWVGLQAGSRTQELTSLAKAAALVGLVVACFAFAPSSAPVATPLERAKPVSHGAILFGLLLALQAVLITYDGWYAPIYFAEEDVDPAKSLPPAAIGGVICCTAIFLLINAALLYVLPMRHFAGSEVPVADAARVVLGRWGEDFVLLIAMITVVSSINATLLMAPRIIFGMSRDRILPEWATTVNKGGTPTWALLMGTALALALVLSGTYDALIAITSVLFVVVYLSGFVALFVLRWRQPERSRPFRAWGYPWTTLFVLLASVGFLAGSVAGDLRHSAFALGLLLLSYPAYVILQRRKARAGAA